jgi:hypothetical protein
MKNQLLDSIAIESPRKRVPVRRAGRLLCAIRDKMVNDIKYQVRMHKYHVPTGKIATIESLNRRISGYFLREDERLQLSIFPMDNNHIYTTERTIIEFKQWGHGVIRATFTGTIDEMKRNLSATRGPVTMLWAHYKRVDDQLVRGMWVDMNVS